ncbi:MAG: hypothetical protein ABI187_06590, partial [Ornithinibacter sp.]
QLVAGEAGTVYEYLGQDGSFDLRTQDYADLGTWRPVPVTSVLPAGFNITESPSATIAAVVVLNDVDSDVAASIAGMLLHAGSVTVEAVQAGTIRSDVDLTASSSGGSSFTGQGRSLAVGGIVATNRVLGGASASVDDSDLTTAGQVSVLATNTSLIEALNAAAISSGSQSVSIILAFNTVGLASTNLFFDTVDALLGDPLISAAYSSVDPVGSIAQIIDSRVQAGGDVVVQATSQAQIRSQVTNAATSAPAAIFGAGGVALAGVLSSNRLETVVSSTITNAAAPGDRAATGTGSLATGDRVRVNASSTYEFTGAPRGPPQNLNDSVQHYASNSDWRLVSTVGASGSIAVTSSDQSEIVAETSLYGAVSKTNDAGAGILNHWIGSVLDDYRFTSRSGTRPVEFGDMVRVADDYDTGATAGKVYQFMGVYAGPGTEIDLGAQDYGDFELWKEVTETGLITSAISYAVLGELSAALGRPLGGTADGYYAVLAYNLLKSASTATVVGTRLVAGGDVTVSAAESAALWAKDDSVMEVSSAGGLVTTNVLLASATAAVTGSDITTSTGGGGDIVVTAVNAAQLDASATSSITALDAKSVVLAFNSVGWRPSNVLFNLAEAIIGDPLISTAFFGETPATASAVVTDSALDADGDITVTAYDQVQLNALSGNDNTANAVATILFFRAGQKADYNATSKPGGHKVGGYGKNGITGGGVLASNKVSSGAEAIVTGGSLRAGGDVSVESFDQSEIISHSSVVQSASAANNLSGIVDIVNTQILPHGYDYTTASGTRTLAAGDRVRLGSTYAGGGTAGAVYEFRGAGTVSLGTTNYADPTMWKLIPDAADENGLDAIVPGLSDFAGLSFLPSDARAVGVLIVYNDVRSHSTARVQDSTVLAGGAVAVRAVLDAELVAELLTNVTASGGSFYGGGTVLAVNIIVATNLVLADAVATIADTPVDAGSVLVEAVMSSGIDATVMASTSTGDTGAAFVLAFNSVGWKTQNLLFNAVDALLGDPLISLAFNGNDVAEAKATLSGSSVVADGAVTVRADNATRLNSTVSNAADSAAGALFNATGKAFGGILVSNKVSSAATATVLGSTITAGGAVLVEATDDTSIFSNTKIVISSTTTNNGGASIINTALGSQLVTPDWMSGQGLQVLKFGDLVQLADDFGDPVATAGVDGPQVVTVNPGDAVEVGPRYGESRLTTGSGIRLLTRGDVVTVEDGYLPGGDGGRSYLYLGPNARLDLSVQDYRVAARWAPVSGSPGSVYRYLGTASAALDLNSTDYGDTDL